jgi:hypothetical protein
MVPFAVTQIRYQFGKCRNPTSLTARNCPFGKDWPGKKIVCFLAAAAGVAAVQTLVTGPRSDHYHAARVAGGRV